MHREQPIGIFDSGVGGMTAIKPVLDKLPNEGVIYIGDSLNMPYGNRPPEEFTKLAQVMVDFLEEKGVKAILIACNTISSAIDRLKSNAPLLSIIQAGARASLSLAPSSSIGVISTIATENSGMYQRAIASLRPDINVIVGSSQTLPKIIDSQLDNRQELSKHIKYIIDPILEQDSSVSKIILGCSHFPIIQNEIAELYPGIELIDPAVELAEMLKESLEKSDLCAQERHQYIHMNTTAETYEYAAAIKRLKLEIDSLIKVKLPNPL
ncbi:MAG: glutamate racemase [Eubacteriaceae bacterium]|nr:glutamate racemase [Eubacteriaceae bacterium]